MKVVLCSECFQNEGLRLEAAAIGMRNGSSCRNCGSRNGRKLDGNRLQKLVNRFFVMGTTPHGVGGYASILHYGPDRTNDEVDLDDKTGRDWALIRQLLGGGLFFYGPPLWRVGVTEHYEEPNVISDKTLVEIINKLSVKSLPVGFKTFRIRKNVDAKLVMEPDQFDIPPNSITREYGRFDDPSTQILYTSPSLPVCLHECRLAITDDIFSATFIAAKVLRVANLTADYKQGVVSPFEDLRYFFNGIFLTRHESTYEIARRISASIRKLLSVDGFITDSFFTTASQEPVSQNYCFYPEAINQQKLKLHSLNRVHLETVSYSYAFGPNFCNYVDPDEV